MTDLSHDAGGAGSGKGPAPLARVRRLISRGVWPPRGTAPTGSRTGRLVVPAGCAALVVASAIALGLVATSPARHHSGLPATVGGSGAATDSGAPTVAAVQAMLDRHGADLLRRDRNAFLADIDTSAAAARYRSAQAAMFDNVAAVPFAAWSYTVSAPETGGSVLGAAATRYHASVLIARIAFAYQLRGIDPAPTQHDLWLTFVRRGGHVRIAGDSDLADQGGQSWRGPWDFGPVSVYRGAACLILAHPGDVTQLAGLAQVVDAAVKAVTAVWGSDWTRQVAVLVPDTSAELQAVLGSPPGSDVAAQTVGDPNNPRTGVRVVLDPDTHSRLSPLGLRIVMRHEVTHVAAWPVTNDQLPSWLVEGFADYVGNLDSGQPVPVAASELATQVRAGKLPAALPTSEQFAAGGAQLPQVYEQAWLACRLIAALAGPAALVRLYHIVAASAGAPDMAVDQGLRTVVHMTLAQFTARWRAYLRGELG